MAFKEVENFQTTVDFKLGGTDSKTKKANPTRVEGYYLGSVQRENKMSKTGFSNKYIFKTKNGNVGVWGNAYFDRNLSPSLVGVMLRITFTGFTPIPGKNPMYTYKIEEDRDNVLPSSETPASVPASEEVEGQYDNSAPLDDYDSSADVDPEDDLPAVDEAPPARSFAPRTPAAPPTAQAQTSVKRLLTTRQSR